MGMDLVARLGVDSSAWDAGFSKARGTVSSFGSGIAGLLSPATAAIAAVTAAQGRYKGIVALSGARTLQLTDQGKLLQSAAVNSPVTVPLNATVAFTVGDQIDCLRGGAGTLSFVATGGVTFIIVSGATQIGAAGLGASLVYLGADTWWIVGGLIP